MSVGFCQLTQAKNQVLCVSVSSKPSLDSVQLRSGMAKMSLKSHSIPFIPDRLGVKVAPCLISGQSLAGVPPMAAAVWQLSSR